MKSETKNCQNCKNDFVIEPDDFSFYEKIKVPVPTWCPHCRMVRRLSFMNVYSIYKRKCDKCEKNTISVYSPDKKNIVYCNDCWWADDWDGTEYAINYDSSRPFFEQLSELARKTPWQALISDHRTNINSDYTNGIGHCKNMYMTFWADFCENVFYSSYLNGLKDSSDCYRMKNCELCYEDVGCHKCYRTFFSLECNSCTDTWFSKTCSGLVNCFGCINLRNKNYCIWNEQYTKELYFEKLKELKINSRESIDNLRKEVYEFWNKYPNRSYIGNRLNINVTGDYIYESKNVHDSYMGSGIEDSKYVQFISVPGAKDCYDYSGWGNVVELIYEVTVTGEGASNVKFCDQCWPNVIDVEYSIYANACKHTFGCVNLKKKENCILNKQYSKEEYERLKERIIEDMKRNPYIDKSGRVWTYGEFLPLEFSPFGYNETLAGQFCPKDKEQALKEGFAWYEKKDNEYDITKKASDLPDTIEETNEDILDEIISCSICNKAYKFVFEELNLMQKLSIPLPHQCFNCRQQIRFNQTNLPNLYDKTCGKCGINIKTPYSQDRPEIVYCEKCYQQEVI
jgi:hypothetical protein